MNCSENEAVAQELKSLHDISDDEISQIISRLPLATRIQLGQCDKTLYSLAFTDMKHVNAEVGSKRVEELERWLQKHGRNLEGLSLHRGPDSAADAFIRSNGRVPALSVNPPWATLVNLRKLTLDGMSIKDTSIEDCMQHSSKLAHLSIAVGGLPYPYSFISPSILQLSSLRSLTLKSIYDAPDLVPENIHLPVLTKLGLLHYVQTASCNIGCVLDLAALLSAMPCLRQLTINGCPDTIVRGNADRLNIQHSSLQSLQLLDVQFYEVASTLACITPHLTCLELSQEYGALDSIETRQLLQVLAKLGSLQRLKLDNPLLSETVQAGDFTVIGTLTALTYLEAAPFPYSQSGNSIMTKMFEKAAGQKMPKLETLLLDFIRHPITTVHEGTVDLAALVSAAPKLQHLEIPSICQLMLSCDDLSSLQSLTALTGLVVKDSAWSQHEVQLLAQLRNLQLLDMSTHSDAYGSPTECWPAAVLC